MTRQPGLLLVSGTGRNSGKTTFVCNLIKQHNVKHSISAIKIAPHAHHIYPDDEVLVKKDHYQIIRETKSDSGKDSSLMLQAGAREVFYIQAVDQHLKSVFQDLKPLLSPGDMYICESGGLRHFIMPDLFFIIHNVDNPVIKKTAAKMIALADMYIERKGSSWNFNIQQIAIREGRWILK